MSPHRSIRLYVIGFLLMLVFTACNGPSTRKMDSSDESGSAHIFRQEAQIADHGAPDLTTYRERASSDDAQTIEECYSHGRARAFVIMNIKPNKLGVGGEELRVKRNPVGDGCFVYDPRKVLKGVERPLVWWVPDEEKGYPLNSPSKLVTPELNWARDDGLVGPVTTDVLAYVFDGKPFTPSEPTKPSVLVDKRTFTMKEYRIYRDVIDTPSSIPESQTFRIVAQKHGVSVEETESLTRTIQEVLFSNKWLGSPESEIRHASDWKETQP